MTTTAAVSSCTGECTVAFTLSPEPFSEERMADMTTMFGLFLLAMIVVYFGRRLIALFEVNQSE